MNQRENMRFIPASVDLPVNGERFLPDMKGAIRWEHLHRYVFARELVAGKVVLDAACGEGYGSSLLATTAARVIGMDLTPRCCEHATAAYASPNLEFMVGDILALPFPDHSFDVIVSFETIEHVDAPQCAIAEFVRVLKPDGRLIISTPDRLHFPAGNPFHRHELSGEEFNDLLAARFGHVAVFGQKVVAGSFIAPMSGIPSRFGWWFGTREPPKLHGEKMMYLIAVCSHESLPELRFGLLEEAVSSQAFWRINDHEYPILLDRWSRLQRMWAWRTLMSLRRFFRDLLSAKRAR